MQALHILIHDNDCIHELLNFDVRMYKQHEMKKMTNHHFRYDYDMIPPLHDDVLAHDDGDAQNQGENLRNMFSVIRVICQRLMDLGVVRFIRF